MSKSGMTEASLNSGEAKYSTSSWKSLFSIPDCAAAPPAGAGAGAGDAVWPTDMDVDVELSPGLLANILRYEFFSALKSNKG